MINLEDLATSYNRKAELAILTELDITDEAKIEYTRERDKYKIACNAKVFELKKQILEHEASISILHRERRNQIKKVKNDCHLQLLELKENLKLDIKEIKQQRKLTLSKIGVNYQRILGDYDKACKDGDLQAIGKRHEFKAAYKEYFLEQSIALSEKEEQSLLQINNSYNEKIEYLHQEQEQKIIDINEKYFQLSKKNELLDAIGSIKDNQKQKELKKEIKSLSQINNQKIERKKAIVILEKEIKEAKAIRAKQEVGNKEYVTALKNEYIAIKKEHRGAIKDIRKESKKYYHSLSKEEKEIYKKHEVYVKQDFRSRRKQKIDAIEKRIFKNINPAYIYILPAFFGAVFFTLLPFVFMLITAFFKLDLATLSNSKFVGFTNFANIFTRDTEFQKSLVNTFIYSFCTVILLTVVTIAMAAWLSKNTRIHNITQTMVFTPHIASMVSISILWIAMLNPQGIINQILAWFGIQGPGWLVQENTSLLSVSFVTVWKDIGYYVLIIISGLQGIPAYIYEAAKLDKSSKSNTFFKLTIPLLVPTLSFVFVTKFINSFKVFAPIEIMTNGGPMGSSMVLSYWIYKVGRIGYNYGQAMSGAIILTIIIAICTFINYRFFKKQVTY